MASVTRVATRRVAIENSFRLKHFERVGKRGKLLFWGLYTGFLNFRDFRSNFRGFKDFMPDFRDLKDLKYSNGFRPDFKELRAGFRDFSDHKSGFVNSGHILGTSGRI